MRRAEAGFTIAELVVTLVIVGVLAAVAIPRFIASDAFEGRSFHDEVAALLRYGQKAAIAQRRTVCVQFGAAARSVQLRIASAAGSATCDTDLPPPVGTGIFTVDADTYRGGGRSTGFDVATAGCTDVRTGNFSFNALGQASAARRLCILSYPASPVQVEAETGYVH